MNCLPSPCGRLSPPRTTTEAPPACRASGSHSLTIPYKPSLVYMLDSSVWRRLPIAIFTLACCKLVHPVRISCALSIPLLATTWLFVARSRSEPYLYSLLGHTPPISRVGGGDTFSPQTRINRFVFLNLSILSLEVHLGLTASPHTPFPTGYITLPVHGRSLPLRLMPSHSRGQPFTRSILLVMKVFQSCSCPFSYFLLPSGSRHT